MKNKIIKKLTAFSLLSAFSLVEVLLSMSILSIFIVGTMKVITVKPSSKRVEYPHGYFECYWDGGKLIGRQFFGVALRRETNGEPFCTFEPPIGAAFLNVNVIFTQCNNITYVDDINAYDIKSGMSLIQSEMQTYANNTIRVYPRNYNIGGDYMNTKFVAIDENNKEIGEYEYTGTQLNTSEDMLIKQIKLTVKEKPAIVTALENDKIGCEGINQGTYGGVFINW